MINASSIVLVWFFLETFRVLLLPFCVFSLLYAFFYWIRCWIPW